MGNSESVEASEAAPFAFLLFAICVLIFSMPFVVLHHPHAYLLRGLLSGVLLAGVFASTRRTWVLCVSVILAVAASVSGWMADLLNSQTIALISYVLVLVDIVFVGLVVAQVVLRRDRITADAVFGGLSVFLLIGVAFMVIYGLVEYSQPGSFQIRGAAILGGNTLTENPAVFGELLYFSLITLSTVGYGDILPIHPLAQILSATEGILGQLFLAVVVARLVGMSLVTARERSERSSE